MATDIKKFLDEPSWENYFKTCETGFKASSPLASVFLKILDKIGFGGGLQSFRPGRVFGGVVRREQKHSDYKQDGDRKDAQSTVRNYF